MTKNINSVSNSSTFEQWVESTNNLVDLAPLTVTVAANSAGDITTGNGSVNGIFGVTDLVVSNTIGGGTIGSPNTLNFVTNTNFTANVSINANVIVVANNIVFGGNSTTNNITIKANTSTSVVSFGGTYVIVNSNLIANGILNIPVGNTNNRPANLQDGIIRYNSDTLSVEYVANGSWSVLQTNPVNANSVVFVPTDKISNTNVQDAIEYLSTSVVQISGNNSISGGIFVINVPNSTLVPDVASTSVIRTIQVEGTTSRFLSDSTRSGSAFSGKRSNGTSGTRTALANNDQIVTYDAFGYTGTTDTNTATASLSIYTAEAWSAANNGSYIVVSVTPVGSNTSANVLTISSNTFAVNTTSMNVSSNVTFTANVIATKIFTVNNFIVTNTSINILNANVASINTLSVANTLTVNGGVVWTSINMGNGSGLDADTLDGHDSSFFQSVLTANNANYLNNLSISTGAQFIANTNGILSTATAWNSSIFANITFASTMTINMSSLINGYLKMTGNGTFATPQNLKEGQSGVIVIQQDTTGNRTLSFSSAWKFPFAITPTLSTGASEIDLLFYLVLPAAASNFIYGNLIKGLT